MSADAKVSGTSSDADLTPDRALEGFYEALQGLPRIDQQFIVGRRILADFLAESDQRLRDFDSVVRHYVTAPDRFASVIGSATSFTGLFTRPVQALPKIFSVREARANFADLLNFAKDRDVMIVRNSKPAAVLLSYERFEDLIDQIEDLQDRLSIEQRENDTVPIEEAFAGLDDD